MIEKYLIIDKEVLPDYFEKVVDAKNMVNSGMDVSKAVKAVGISRSTYYKYKDYVFTPQEDLTGKKAIISLLLKNEKGILSEVLNDLLLVNVNILSVSQSIIINKRASLELVIDMGEMLETIEQLLQRLSDMDGVVNVRLVAIE
ncbi:ACT domain-containing protein [Traorella massiliensis]|uniref:ACT domain-containing protein n=1 Tax=Traorella massiliensis TaxID=1903263 RepID=UPI00248DC93C|nr:ACT domain-containing protein [Traorella massiliensis]